VAFADLIAELRGAVPKIPFSFCKTLINRAWREIRESQLWSFNIVEFSWPTPSPIQAGTVNVTQGSPTIIFDATAIAAILTGSTIFSLITTRQFRVSVAGGIYNLIALDANFAVNGIATLDRPYDDPSSTTSSYQIYQLYYTPPMSDFLTLTTVRNPAMYLNLDLTKTRASIDARDPQRSWYQFPTHVVPFGRDQRGAGTATPSATLGFPLYELWGQPVTFFTYQVYGLRRGTDLANPTDTLPFAVGDDLVLAKAYYYTYQWAEANKDQQPRSQGPDFRFLMGSKADEYRKLLTLYRKQDRELVNSYFSVRDPDISSHAYGYYNTLAKTAGPYTQL
jgi:hypothetical protein